MSLLEVAPVYCVCLTHADQKMIARDALDRSFECEAVHDISFSGYLSIAPHNLFTPPPVISIGSHRNQFSAPRRSRLTRLNSSRLLSHGTPNGAAWSD